MQFWGSDFVGDTLHLSASEVGAYMLLLIAMWNNGGTLPDDPKALKRIARGAVSDAVLKFFVPGEGGITQTRLKKEYERTLVLIQTKRASGKKGGDAKALKIKEAGLANATISLEQKAGIPEPEPEPDKKKRKRVVDHAPNGAAPAFENWNTMANHLSLAPTRALTADRIKKMKAIIGVHGLDGWNAALRNIADMPFCCGENDRQWKVTIDWLLKPSNFVKVLEKAYEKEAKHGV
jgi:uncharacterized protein YdaU (DUF1376 family)